MSEIYEGEFIVVKTQGPLVTFHQRPLKRRKSSTPGATHSRSNFARRLKRRDRELRRLAYSIRDQADCFVTLSYPQKVARSITSAQMGCDINSIATKCRYHFDFEGYWFLHVKGWAPKAGFHVHLIGTLGINLQRTEEFLREQWLKTIGLADRDEDYGHLVHLSPLRSRKEMRIRISYLLKRSKIKERMKVLKWCGTDHSFGLRGKDNVRRYKAKEYVLSIDDLAEFRKALVRDVRSQTKGLNDNQKRHIRRVRGLNSGHHVLSNPKRAKKLRRMLKSKDVHDE